MKLNVEELNFNAHHYEEENFEAFDDIYDSVMLNKIADVEVEDIVKLCEIFTVPFEDIHPHQYIKIQRITYYVINKVGIEKGFEKLIEGLFIIPLNHVDEYLNMLINSYSREEILIFKKILDGSSVDKKAKIYNALLGFLRRNDRYKDIEQLFIGNQTEWE